MHITFLTTYDFVIRDKVDYRTVLDLFDGKLRGQKVAFITLIRAKTERQILFIRASFATNP